MSTGIEWADETWNPLIGCSKVSPGCDNCYAIGVVGRQMSPQHVGLTTKPDGGRQDWTGEVRAVPHKLDEPLRWTRPRRVFVNSLSDLFHPDVLGLEGTRDGYSAFLIEVLAVMAAATQHTFQVLTKRPQIMARVLADPGVRMRVNAEMLRRGYPVMPGGDGSPWPAHIWWGTSIESDRYAFRADHLRATPAAVRWISAEPLLGALPSLDLAGIDWLVVGGESGPGARAMHPDWARDLRDRCLDAGTAFFFKQWGAWTPDAPERGPERRTVWLDGSTHSGGRLPPGGAQPCVVWNVGKKAAGRELDGRTWDDYPQEAPCA